MPRRAGLRDDDIYGRLADLETRMDAAEAGREPPTRADDPYRVPERDERRDTELRARQVHVTAEPAEPGYPPGMPDSMGGEMQPDRTRTMTAEQRDAAERRAARDAEDGPPAKKK